MNREIKFRVWDGKTMLDSTYVDSCIGLLDVFDGKTDLIPLQFTGLKDKNGKEIYEGDIVKTNSDTRFVVRDSGGFGTQKIDEYDTDWLHSKSFEWLIETIENRGTRIIGNIYENPELTNL